MAQEATKTEYAIALVGLLYIGAFTTAEQVAELGGFAYRRIRCVLGEPADADARAIRPSSQRPRR